MQLHVTVVFGCTTVTAPTGTVPLLNRTVRFPVAAYTGGANICLHNKFV